MIEAKQLLVITLQQLQDTYNFTTTYLPTMYTVDLRLKNFTSDLGYIQVLLKPDQALNYQKWNPPITWSGYISNEQVKFIQIDASGSSVEYFDWSEFPEKFLSYRHQIVSAIDEAMKVMD